MRNDTTPPIRSVQKALKVLGVFARYGRVMGITEISVELGLPKSVTYKLLSTLAAEGFVTRDPVLRRYSIGPVVLALAGAYLNDSQLTRDGADALRRLSEATKHTVSLGILDRATVLYVATREGLQAVKTSARVGDRRPLHATATGKVLLADLGDGERDRLLGPGPLRRFTANTIVERRALKKELDQVRRAGLAYNRREHVESVAAVAAAVCDYRGRVVAGISIGVPSARGDVGVLRALAPHVVRCAAELSEALGAPSSLVTSRSGRGLAAGG